MRKLLLIAALVLFSFGVKAQSIREKDIKETNEKVVEDTSALAKSDTLIYPSTETEPEFPGGIAAFYKYIIDNIKNTGAIGKVFISLVVEKDGSLTHIKIERGLSESADKEAIRLITLSPKWKPGIQSRHRARVRYTVPISFR
jgi:protein TonB